MRSVSYIVVLLSLGGLSITTDVSAQLSWPLDTYAAPQRIETSLGELSQFKYGYQIPHHGIDIPSDIDVRVRCVQAGRIDFRVSNPPDEYDGCYVTNDTTIFQYLHERWNQVLDGDSPDQNETVDVGATVGRVVSHPLGTHLHFTIQERADPSGTYRNPLAYLSPQATYAAGPCVVLKPDGDPAIKLVPNGRSWSDATFKRTRKNGKLLFYVRGKVDVIASIRSTFSGSGREPADDSERWAVPYSAGIVITRTSDPTPPALSKTLFRFDTVPQTSDKTMQLYGSDSEVTKLFYMVLTNCIDSPTTFADFANVDADQCWDTDQVDNGEYEVTVRVEDMHGGSGSASVLAVVDNGMVDRPTKQ